MARSRLSIKAYKATIHGSDFIVNLVLRRDLTWGALLQQTKGLNGSQITKMNILRILYEAHILLRRILSSHISMFVFSDSVFEYVELYMPLYVKHSNSTESSTENSTENLVVHLLSTCDRARNAENQTRNESLFESYSLHLCEEYSTASRMPMPSDFLAFIILCVLTLRLWALPVPTIQYACFAFANWRTHILFPELCELAASIQLFPPRVWRIRYHVCQYCMSFSRLCYYACCEHYPVHDVYLNVRLCSLIYSRLISEHRRLHSKIEKSKPFFTRWKWTGGRTWHSGFPKASLMCSVVAQWWRARLVAASHGHGSSSPPGVTYVFFFRQRETCAHTSERGCSPMSVHPKKLHLSGCVPTGNVFFIFPCLGFCFCCDSRCI